MPVLVTFARVTVPICLPAILDIAVYLFVNAMTTVSAVIFLYGPDTKLASIAVVHMDEAGQDLRSGGHGLHDPGHHRRGETRPGAGRGLVERSPRPGDSVDDGAAVNGASHHRHTYAPEPALEARNPPEDARAVCLAALALWSEPNCNGARHGLCRTVILSTPPPHKGQVRAT